MEAVCRDTYYRPILEGGLQGLLRVALGANIINDAVKSQGCRGTPRAERRLPRKRRSSPTRSRNALEGLAEGDLTFRLADFP